MGTKYCTNCGEANALDAEFCINCGMKFPNKSDSPQNKVSTPVKVKSSSPSTSPKRKVTPQADLTSLRKQSRNFFILIVVLAIIVLAGVQIGKYNKTNEQKQKIAKIIDDYWVKGTFDTSINVKKKQIEMTAKDRSNDIEKSLGSKWKLMIMNPDRKDSVIMIFENGNELYDFQYNK